MKDKVIFIWILSTISDSMLPHLLCCKHAFGVWDKIHKHFNAHMKACVRKLRVELKPVKKGYSLITEYVLHVKEIAKSLLVVGDTVSEQDQIYYILDGFP